jgi:dUTPase
MLLMNERIVNKILYKFLKKNRLLNKENSKKRVGGFGETRRFSVRKVWLSAM